jgi:lipopolysaccharide biosynthesis protein
LLSGIARSIKTYLPEKYRRKLRLWRKQCFRIFHIALEDLSFLFKGEPAVILAVDGRIRPSYGRPICFFSNYDANSQVKDYIYYYLSEIVSAGCDVVFVSTNDELKRDDIKKLSDLCVKIILRQNRGYDFYSWKTGMSLYTEFGRHESVLLLNDSVIGPFVPFSKILARLRCSPFQITGMTDSRQFSYHIQSYLFFIKKDEKTLRFLEYFFRFVKPYNDKNIIIHNYEIGFSKMATKTISIGALFPIEATFEVIDGTEIPMDDVNQLIVFWRELIVSLHFPFIKKSVLMKSMTDSSVVAEILRRSHFSFDIHLLPNKE